MDDVHDTSWLNVFQFAVLKPEYAHFTKEQIQALQELHDTHEYWLKPLSERGTEGLSVFGKSFVSEIKAKYLNPETPES